MNPHTKSGLTSSKRAEGSYPGYGVGVKILLTGGTGLIGQALGAFLKEKGASVLSYDMQDNPKDDILDFRNLKEKIKGVDGIVHLAAVSQPKSAYKSPKDCVNINIAGTANVLEAARAAKKENYPWIIFISSREVFGEAQKMPVTEETPHNPQSLYGLTKEIGEELCRIFSETYGLKTRILRLTSVYGGRGDKLDRVIPKFIIQASKNEPLTILGKGDEFFDFTHVSDIAEGVWRCIEEVSQSKKLCDDFILSFGQPVSLRQLAEIVIKETKSVSSVKYEEAPQFSVTRYYADCRKAKKILGFKPKININEGIKLVISEFKTAKII